MLHNMKLLTFKIIFQIKSFTNYSARSFDLPSRQRNKQASFRCKRQISLTESYFKLHHDYQHTYEERKNENRTCLKNAFSPKEATEDYDLQLFDIEDQADKEKSW